MDLVQIFEDEFASHEFYAWSPWAFGRPTQLSTSPIRKWAWDSLPFYKVSFLYIPAGSSPHNHEPGEWMLEISIDTDDLDFPKHRGEPNAATFPDASTTNTTLKLVAWTCTEAAKFNWFHGLWNNKRKWPPTDGKPFQHVDHPVQSLSLTTQLADLPDRDAVMALIGRFRDAIAAQNDFVANDAPLAKPAS